MKRMILASYDDDEIVDQSVINRLSKLLNSKTFDMFDYVDGDAALGGYRDVYDSGDEIYLEDFESDLYHAFRDAVMAKLGVNDDYYLGDENYNKMTQLCRDWAPKFAKSIGIPYDYLVAYEW